jgi:hypothetical protein
MYQNPHLRGNHGKSEALVMFFRDGEGLKVNFIGRASKTV